jgi:membrane protease YdiL (CAAX protease family)
MSSRTVKSVRNRGWAFIFFLLPWQSSAFLEEIGFRGYALERLQNKLGPLVGTLILGAFFGAWLLPEFFQPGSFCLCDSSLDCPDSAGMSTAQNPELRLAVLDGTVPIARLMPAKELLLYPFSWQFVNHMYKSNDLYI